MRSEDRYLLRRGRCWHYVRRVPGRLADIDNRGMIRVALQTQSLEVARMRRDALAEADDLYWASLVGGDTVPRAEAVAELKQEVAARRYRAATRRAMARGFVYAPASELAELTDLAELLTRIRIVDTKDVGKPSEVERAEAEALLGGVKPPPVTISQAFDVYCKEIAVGELIGKSEAQRRIWMKTKQRGVQYFINVVGDRPLAQITRQDALQYYNWWKERLIPKVGRPTLRANTANRDLGNVRKLFAAYFKHFGEENRPNPFRNLSFSETTTATVPPFENRWVRERILAPGALDGINRQAALIVYALIETGCRPSEIANLEAGDIRLNCDVPHIRIRPGKAREIKTRSSIRDIPLVGVSLAAFREAPRGFPHYRDKPDLLSATLLSAFRARDLLPTEEHVIYSFRHSFEKRMLEAGIDYALRCTLMGHRNTRPSYGDGGSLQYRREELLKIVHPFADALFGTFERASLRAA